MFFRAIRVVLGGSRGLGKVVMNSAARRARHFARISCVRKPLIHRFYRLYIQPLPDDLHSKSSLWKSVEHKIGGQWTSSIWMSQEDRSYLIEQSVLRSA